MAFIKTHQPCPSCQSSDGLSINEDNSTYCFVCNTHTKGEHDVNPIDYVPKEPLVDLAGLVSPSIASRRIAKATVERYGVKADASFVYFPYTKNNTVVAAKKRGIEEKTFSTVGDWKSGSLFGQELFTKGGKYVTLVEGEYDALAVYQMLGSKYPVVSVRNGASGAVKDCKDQYEWLSSFDNIVICFDNDAVGKQAADGVASLFSGKAKVFKGVDGYKDGCDFLVAGKEKEFIDRWWSAELSVPDGIVAGSSLWEEVSAPVIKSDCDYPWDGLNELTYGIRAGELVTVTAGSGLGKSQFLRELVWHVLNNTQENIGLMFLEESVKKTALSIMSMAANTPLHLPDVTVPEQQRKEAFDATLGTDRLFLFDHFGSTSIDNIVNRVRFLSKGMSCKYVFLDHISIIVSAQESGDERKAIDEIMTRLRMMVQETGIALIVVSHLKRPSDKGHEEGAATSLAQLRGSGSIAQLSDMVIGLERNGQHEDITERNTTKVRVLKNRFSGTTGPACKLLYNKYTGRMTEREQEAL